MVVKSHTGMSVVSIKPLYKSAIHMAGLVSSILDKVHYLQKKEMFIQHQRLWGLLTFSKYKRDTDLIL